MKKRFGIVKRILIAGGGICVMATASCAQTATSNVGFTSARAIATSIAAVGLINFVVGLSALRAAGRMPTGSGVRTVALAVSVIGLIVIILSIMHLNGTPGGFGTGGGRAGAIAALILGLLGMISGGLALIRTRRAE